MGPLWSQGLEAISVSYDALGKTGIEGSQRERHCLERLRKDVDEIGLVDLYLLGSDVGPLWSQRSEGTSVSIGCGRGCARRLGFRCRTIMVVRIRSISKQFLSVTMLWERLE